MSVCAKAEVDFVLKECLEVEQLISSRFCGDGGEGGGGSKRG